MLERFVDETIAGLRGGEPQPPAALTVLVRVFAATARDDIGEALGDALAASMSGAPAGEPLRARADRLCLYAEAARLSDDDRLRVAAGALAANLQQCWRDRGVAVADQAIALHAVLAACDIVDATRFGTEAIDHLEHVAAAHYAPGAALGDRPPADAVYLALALLAGFEVSGRLAYPMLAEELMQPTRRRLAAEPTLVGCAGARVLARLGRLHADDGYRATAVLAPGVDYHADAESLLDALADRAATAEERAAYALALTECANRS